MGSSEIQQLSTQVNSIRTALSAHLQRFSEFVDLSQRLRDAHTVSNDMRDNQVDALGKWMHAQSALIEAQGKKVNALIEYVKTTTPLLQSHINRIDALAKYLNTLSTFIEHRLTEIEKRVGIVPPARLTDYLLEDSTTDDAALRAKASWPSLLSVIIEEDESRRRGDGEPKP